MTARASRPLHMHGELRRARCLACAAAMPWAGDLSTTTPCPSCAATALRPDIVWFGEMPMGMDRIADAIEECGLFVSVGTSGTVYPTAGFVTDAAHVRTVELNLEPSANDTISFSPRIGFSLALLVIICPTAAARGRVHQPLR